MDNQKVVDLLDLILDQVDDKDSLLDVYFNPKVYQYFIPKVYHLI